MSQAEGLRLGEIFIKRQKVKSQDIMKTREETLD